MSSPLSKQVAGSHYKNMKFQPVEIIEGNGLNWNKGNMLKYTLRCGSKGDLDDALKDLDKVIHYAELEKERITNGYNPKEKEV